jgi:exodeoxyribonuclease III
VKVATFNVNSLRKRIPIVLGWLQKNNPDVLCLQETKVHDSEFPLKELQAAGYHVYFRGMKTFNGVATLCREKPDNVIYGLEEGPDGEDFRILQVVIGGIPIINTYVPNGTLVGSEKYAHKLRWFERLRDYFQTHLDPKKPAIWLGDMNIAPEPIDVFAPQRYTNDPCFHIDARNAYKETLAWGFVDVFRQKEPQTVQYTYWDFFRQHFARDRGWRLDHILATKPLAAKLQTFTVDLEPRRMPEPSDHTVVVASFRLA